MFRGNLLHCALAVSMFFATPAWSFQLDDSSTLACEVSDAGNYLPANFAERLCSELSAGLNLAKGSATETFPSPTLLLVKIQTLTNHAATFALVAHTEGKTSGNETPIYGPIQIEVADADLELALPSHLQNELRRLFGR